MTRHHVIISGTGRSGTTFLVQLFTELKLDTGYSDTDQFIDPNCRAGLEKDLRDPNAPYIVKSPWLIDYLGDMLQNNEVVIDHAIIPIRDLFSAAESRRFVVRQAGSTLDPDQINGGLWHTKELDAQESVLTFQFYSLFYTLSKYDIPTTLLFFPRFATDPEYLYKKISFVLQKQTPNSNVSRLREFLKPGVIKYPAFLKAFMKTSKPELIHSFSNQ